MDINSAVGRKAGLSDGKLLEISDTDRSAFNDKERLVIELADATANTPSNISDDLYARLRKLFSEEQLLELGAPIAFENYRARFNRVFAVESDRLYTPLPVVERAGTSASRASEEMSKSQCVAG